jgi:hypothetical protein
MRLLGNDFQDLDSRASVSLSNVAGKHHTRGVIPVRAIKRIAQTTNPLPWKRRTLP